MSPLTHILPGACPAPGAAAEAARRRLSTSRPSSLTSAPVALFAGQSGQRETWAGPGASESAQAIFTHTRSGACQQLPETDSGACIAGQGGAAATILLRRCA